MLSGTFTINKEPSETLYTNKNTWSFDKTK